MEIKRKARMVTDFLGGLPAVGSENVLKGWIEGRQDKAFLSQLEKTLKKGQTAMGALEEILSVLHRDDKGNPVLEAYMLKRCLRATGSMIFNAMKNRNDPKKAAVENGILEISPAIINLYNGKLIKSPDGIRTTTISKKNGPSFFKAYEYVKSGVTFDVTINYDEDLLSPEQMERLLSKCGIVGVGAWRERFGKFEWVN